MLRLVSRLAVALSLAVPLLTRAQALPAQEPADGRIVSDVGRTEVLGRPLRAGDVIELPEGFIRVEEDGTEDREVGSFTVLPAEAFARSGAAAASPSVEAGHAVAALPEGDAARTYSGLPATRPGCREERRRYLAELWRISGIEVSDPDALIEGLEGAGAGPDAGFYWFALATDPFRPLAWSSELRSRAEALSRCVRGD